MSDQTIDSNVNIVNKYCKYLNRKVVVKTVKSSHTGSLKCIDPLTETIVLLVTDSETNSSKLVIVLSHSIRSIELVDDSDLSDDMDFDLHQFLSTSMSESNEKPLNDEELEQKRQKVVKGLQKNRIPCEELDDGSLCIAYALTLTPPYTRDQCICANEMVLHQIQTFLDSLSKEST
jgi:hypothetical protein